MTVFGTAAAIEIREEQKKVEKRKDAGALSSGGGLVQVDARQLVSFCAVDLLQASFPAPSSQSSFPCGFQRGRSETSENWLTKKSPLFLA